MKQLLLRLASQDRAVANAREASIACSQDRVRRHEVELYLQALAERPRGSRSA